MSMPGLPTVDLLTRVSPYVSRWGYLLVAVMVMLGNLGVPIPEETVLLVGGYFAAKGVLTIWWLIATAIVSATGGDALGYVIGRQGGRRLLIRYGAALRITPERLRMAERSFERYGPWMVFAARFIAGLRFMAGPLAGALRMTFARFLPYNAAGAVVYCSAITLIAYLLAPSFDRLIHLFAVLNWTIGLVVLVLAVAVGGWALGRRAAAQGPH